MILSKWLDEFVLAGKGIGLAARKRSFWLGFIVTFVVFGTLMNLLSGGMMKFELMAAGGFFEGAKIVFNSMLGIFGYEKMFLDFLPMFIVLVLQSTLIGVIVFLWRKKRNSKSESVSNSANVEKAGIIAGLVALGAGCPTCGTTLIAPLIGAIFSTGGLVVAGIVSQAMTILAVIIAVLSLKKIGLEAYVIIKNEKYLAKRKREGKNE